MSTTDTTNYFLKKVTEGTEVDDWAPFINGNWDKVSTQMKLNADGVAANTTALAGKASLSHTHGTADIVNDAITNAKLADMPANTIKGSNSASPANPLDLTVAQTMSLLGAASLAGPTAFTGTGANAPTATTAAVATNTTQIATTAFVMTAIAAIPGAIGGAINNKTSSYSLVLADAGDLIEMNVGSPNILTVPLNSAQAFPVGTRIDIVQTGGGQTTIAPAGGVNLRSSGSKLKLTTQYSAATLMKRGTDDWYVWGDLSA